MTEQALYQVDAFADRLFEGNPAAVLVMDGFLADETLQAIAAENNLAETAFAVRTGEGRYDLRWFTPTVEVALCGHATLATAHVLWTEWREGAETLRFDTRSGPLFVERRDGRYAMDLPAGRLDRIDTPEGLAKALGAEPMETYAGQYLMVVLKDEAKLRALAPDMAALRRVRNPLPGTDMARHCVCVTAAGEDTDFVSRFFGPTAGIDEDPVTGSAHCMLTKYWAEHLGRHALTGYQASARGGHVGCKLEGNRVRLTGGAVTYLRGTIARPFR